MKEELDAIRKRNRREWKITVNALKRTGIVYKGIIKACKGIMICKIIVKEQK